MKTKFLKGQNEIPKVKNTILNAKYIFSKHKNRTMKKKIK